jgi:NAD(P)-dependent dehydrogenase (short-subunit alcohol dehydrogenase family)
MPGDPLRIREHSFGGVSTLPDGLLTLDVTNAAQIQAVERVESLDILINNAGLVLYEDLSDRAVLEQSLAVNLFGPYGVTQGLFSLPALTLMVTQQRPDSKETDDATR